jgi:hydroxymethylglutaryl-CoA lyase
MIRIVEVGPRDGLQNEPVPIPTEEKAAFVGRLLAAGVREIEVTSFVSPKWVPQLGDAETLWPMLPPGGIYSALIPNAKGLERALATGVERIAVFTAVSGEFTRKNINMTVQESLIAIRDVLREFRAQLAGGYVRAYVSTAFECPYAGRIEPQQTVELAYRLMEMGANEVSIGDTIGVAAPPEVKKLTSRLLKVIPAERIAYHFHDTRGTAIANVAQAFAQGIRTFDSSAGGLGGCPYAPGAGGNLATEDLAYLLERSGAPTGIDLTLLAQASLPILDRLGRKPLAKSQLATLGRRG